MEPCGPEQGCASWETFGTSIELRLTCTSALSRARASVQCELDAIDRACSRFRADSELSRINGSDGRPVRASSLLMEALELSLSAAELTDGAVDPTVGRALELAGYDRDWRLLRPVGQSTSLCSLTGDTTSPKPPSSIRAHIRSGWQTVCLDRRRGTIRIPRGIHLDLGATAKAWAADRAAQIAATVADCGALVSIGGDIATCGHPPPGGWPVHVTDDHRSKPSARGQTISIDCGGLATSSTVVRRWQHRGRDMHHIIDPRSGRPALAAWRTVSVAAATCAQANIATTASIVRGDSARRWLAQLGLPARLVNNEGHVFVLGDWPTERA